MCGKCVWFGGLFAFFIQVASAEPLLTSWYTERSGAYARIYETTAAESNQTSVTTWSRGQGVQAQPTYAGVHEISHTDNWVYLRTSNLASHIMGPWYGNEEKTNLFPNYPSNRGLLWRIPRMPTAFSNGVPQTLTGGGTIGFFVNGVSMFDSRDAFSFDGNTMQDQSGNAGGDGAWNRDAYVNESVTFDPANAHQAGPTYHYHANPPALRYQLGDSVRYDVVSNWYTEAFNGAHSPILGWVRDGLPVYGPYAYADPMDPSSPVVRMRSGFQLRTDIATTDSPRNTWPAWATRLYAGRVAFANGPNVGPAFPLGRYLEDNDYKGDLGLVLGVDFDLNESNVRFGKTPEFPEGTWAYFVCIEADGTPVVPYNIGRAYFRQPTGSDVTAIPHTDEASEAVTMIFEGGPEAPLALQPKPPESGEVTLVWSATEGGAYEIQATDDLRDPESWTNVVPQFTATNDFPQLVSQHLPGTDTTYFRTRRTGLADFDDLGFAYPWTAPTPPGGPARITVPLSGGPADLNELPLTLTFNGSPLSVPAAQIERPTRQSITFTVSTFGLPPGDYNVEAQFTGGPLRTGTFTVHTNILLMIVDDWGHDASPLDNTEPSAVLARMPHLETLASQGVRFTRAYAQPTCSPMRATVLTGRHPFQHRVGSPVSAGQFSNAQDEITLPEIFDSTNTPHQLLTVGKWHLGGNDSGYADRGGWPEFYGINGGGVVDYGSWSKNNNGTSANSTTYSTTDQVNETVAFISRHTQTGTPWFSWVAFNAPHTPFHLAPAELAPVGGYSTQQPGESANAYQYRTMLEALDTEIGRLLSYIDPASTQIILIGDNGTPGQVVQAPYGNGHAKGSLFNGGIHVPLIAKGPAIDLAPGSTNTSLVHCVDLFSTILDLAGIDASGVSGLNSQDVQSVSLLPLFQGTDTADRCVVSETFGTGEDGRAIMLAAYPDYKLIIHGDPTSTIEDPTFSFFHLPTDINEMNPLDVQSLTGTALDAFTACVAKDAALGGGYSDPPGNFDTVYITLPSTGVTPNVPGLTQPNGSAIRVTSVTVDGQAASVVGRFDAGSSLSDEGDDQAAQYGVKVRISPANGGPYTTAHVVFPNQPVNQGGAAREYDSVGALLVNPNP